MLVYGAITKLAYNADKHGSIRKPKGKGKGKGKSKDGRATKGRR